MHDIGKGLFEEIEELRALLQEIVEQVDPYYLGEEWLRRANELLKREPGAKAKAALRG